MISIQIYIRETEVIPEITDILTDGTKIITYVWHGAELAEICMVGDENEKTRVECAIKASKGWEVGHGPYQIKTAW